MSIFTNTIHGIGWKYGSEGEDLPMGSDFKKLLIPEPWRHWFILV